MELIHLRKHRSSWGNNGCVSLCGKRVEYCPTVVSKIDPRRNCPDCLELMIDKKQDEVRLLKEYLAVVKPKETDSECYKKIGMEVSKQDTQNQWTQEKNEDLPIDLEAARNNRAHDLALRYCNYTDMDLKRFLVGFYIEAFKDGLDYCYEEMEK